MRSILVVDDEAEIRRAISEGLGESGWRVAEAESADEALELLVSGQLFDTVITDVRMPGNADGVDLARVAVRFGIEVIVISGYTGLDRNPVIAEGLGTFLPKPFTFGQLMRVLAKTA